MARMRNLLPEPAPTLLPDDDAAAAALAAALAGGGELPPALPATGDRPAGSGTGDSLATVAARFPAYSGAWAALAGRALRDGDPVTGYAFARTGYHRGLDLLRRNGWRGSGPVPWSHEPNRGFLRSLQALSVAASAIGETGEADRCTRFLRDCDPEAEAALRG